MSKYPPGTEPIRQAIFCFYYSIRPDEWERFAAVLTEPAGENGDAYSHTARLIGAAPEMLDAGEAMADAYRQLLAIHYGDTKNVCPTLKEWDAVVRKVEGEAAEGSSK